MTNMKEDIENYFIDTNIFLRVFVKENEKSYNDCLSFLHVVENGKNKFFISNFVIAEINWVLKSFYKIQKDEVIKDIESILRIRNIKINDKCDIHRCLEMYKENGVKYVDALIASNKILQNKNAVIVSYDKDFDKMGIRRVEPCDF